jgi:arylsulfatase
LPGKCLDEDRSSEVRTRRSSVAGGAHTPFTPLRLPKIFNLRSDPFELADHDSIDYVHWRFDRTFLLVPAQQYIGGVLATFRELPPSDKVGSLSLDQVLEMLQEGND